MCGIAGFVTVRGDHAAAGTLRKMTGAIHHRGPDAEGFWEQGPAALGHRRLSIIDLSAGAQPMANEDESVWIVYNGEIFNHASLRPALEQAGHRYHSRCDTETIIHAYEQHGPESLQLYRGMFAFALWDSRSRTLFCARDRMGIKPFYYYWDDAVFVFASEIKALLAHPAVGTRLNPDVVAEYMTFGYGSNEATLFGGIRKLMPGHWLRLDAASGQLRIERYWDVPARQETAPLDEREWIAECRRRLEETVQMRLMSDVPLGAFLSGGVDSSAITALAQRMTGAPVKTFSVGYAEAAYSELGYAAQVAAALGTEHNEITISRDDFFSHLPKLIYHEDEPICWPSSVSLYFVSKLAAQQVKVVLTGEGADEIFAGYYRYGFYFLNERALRAWRVLPAPLRAGVQRWTASTPLLPAPLRRKLEHTFLGRDDAFESLYLDNFYGAFPAAERAALLTGGDRSSYASYMEYWNAASQAPNTLDRLLYADQKTYLVELLMKQDQMSMATSIESRVPLLDHTLVEFAARVPASLKLRGRTGKHIFKAAVSDLLPDSIVNRPKMGFPTPLRDWLSPQRAGALIDALEDRDGLLAAITNRDALHTLLNRHRQGEIDGTDRIWRLLNFQIWGDHYITGRGAGRWEALVGAPAATPV